MSEALNLLRATRPAGYVSAESRPWSRYACRLEAALESALTAAAFYRSAALSGERVSGDEFLRADVLADA